MKSLNTTKIKRFFVKVIDKEGYPGLVGEYLFISWKK